MKVLILCGGLGTRLGTLTKDTPKPLLNVAGKPFIAYLLDILSQYNISGFVLAAGFQWEKLYEFIGDQWNGIPVNYSIENDALGTGGAIKKSLELIKGNNFLIFNGDTIFNIDLKKFIDYSVHSEAQVCIALRKIDDCSRYGKVEIDSNGRIIMFGEKGVSGPGLINGGIYFLKTTVLKNFPLEKFSFETSYLQEKYLSELIYGLPFDNYFIDIGIPSDFNLAQSELRRLVA